MVRLLSRLATGSCVLILAMLARPEVPLPWLRDAASLSLALLGGTLAASAALSILRTVSKTDN